jgi:hypothetical protein
MVINNFSMGKGEQKIVYKVMEIGSPQRSAYEKLINEMGDQGWVFDHLLYESGLIVFKMSLPEGEARIMRNAGQKAKDIDLFKILGSLATFFAFIVAAIALFINYRIYKRRVAFDSLIKLCEIFHIELENHRDLVAEVTIADENSLNEHLKKVKSNDMDTLSIQRSIIKILNFYALIGMMTQDKQISEDIGIKYFGSVICHKVEDWKALIQHLEKDKNYKEMVDHVKYICNRASNRKK